MSAINQRDEDLLRLALLIRNIDTTGQAQNTPTYQRLMSQVGVVLMDSSTHTLYTKIAREVESEVSSAVKGQFTTLNVSLRESLNGSGVPAS